MRDTLSVRRIQLLHPKVRGAATAFIEECESTLDVTIRVVQGLRTFEEQDALYAQGRTKPGNKVTAAKGGQSFHCFGLAIDIVPIQNSKADWSFDFDKLSALCTKYGLTSGKAWNDNDHYEFNFGHGPSGWRYFLDLHNAHAVDAEGYIIFPEELPSGVA